MNPAELDLQDYLARVEGPPPPAAPGWAFRPWHHPITGAVMLTGTGQGTRWHVVGTRGAWHVTTDPRPLHLDGEQFTLLDDAIEDASERGHLDHFDVCLARGSSW